MRRTIFDEDHDAFRESCRTFVDRALRPNHEKHMANHGFGREVWEDLADQGFLKRDGAGFYALVPGK